MVRQGSVVCLLVLSSCLKEPAGESFVDGLNGVSVTEKVDKKELKGDPGAADDEISYELTGRKDSLRDSDVVALDSPSPAARPRTEKAKMARKGVGRGYRSDIARPAPPPPSSYPIQHQQVEPASNTEQFTNYGINGFTLAERDAQSTFSVDVDTASYTISRKKLRAGYLPPTSAVRVEEFVNYFPYEYSKPKGSDPFSVDIEAAPSPWNTANHLVRIGVQGKKVSFNERKSVHLTFLVDVSGSMNQDDKLGLLKQTLKMLTQELEDGDTVAIATYAGATKVVLEPTPISQRSRILRSLDGLTASGSTAMGAGIDLAYGLADRSFKQGAVNRVIVCSDGDANVGQTSHTALATKIKGYAKKGITLTTVGVGNGNYKDTMMEQLANKGDGNYFYIDSMTEARRIFSDKLTSTMEVIAKDVKIQVEWDKNAVIAYRLVGYENRNIADRDFRNDTVDAGEIGSGHQVTAIYEVAFKDGIPSTFGSVRLRNKAPGPDAPAVERAYTMSNDSIQNSFGALSKDTRMAVGAAGFAEILRGSPHMNEVNLSDIRKIVQGAQRAEYTEDKELLELVNIASRLKGSHAISNR